MSGLSQKRGSFLFSFVYYYFMVFFGVVRQAPTVGRSSLNFRVGGFFGAQVYCFHLSSCEKGLKSFDCKI